MKGLPPPKSNPFDAIRASLEADGIPERAEDRAALRTTIMQAVSAETYAETKRLLLEGIMAFNKDATIDEEFLAAVLGVFGDDSE